MSTAPLEYILSSTYNTSGLPELQITITDNSLVKRGRERSPKIKPQYPNEIYPNTQTAVTNGKKVAVLKTNSPLLNRNNIFISVFPNQGASMIGVG